MIFNDKKGNIIDVSMKRKHLMVAYQGELSTYSIYDLQIALTLLSDNISDDIRLKIEKWVIDNTEYLNAGDLRNCDCFLKLNKCYCEKEIVKEVAKDNKVKVVKNTKIITKVGDQLSMF